MQKFYVDVKKIMEMCESEWLIHLVDAHADALNQKFFLLYEYADGKSHTYSINLIEIGGTLRDKIEWPGQKHFSEQ